MSFPIVTNSGTNVQVGSGLLYSNVFYFVAGRTTQVYSFTVPAGITTIRARVWGGGAGCYPSAGSGGGGGFAIKTVTVTPGNTFNITAGQGGGVNATGGNSSFGSFVSATGGIHAAAGGTGGTGIGGDKNSNGQGSSSISAAFFGANAGNYFISYSTTNSDANQNSIGISFLPGSVANQLDLIGTAGVFNNASTTGGRGGAFTGTGGPTTYPGGPSTCGTSPGGAGGRDVDGVAYPGGGGLVVIEY